jgi:HEAT repeat protein
MPSKSTKNPRRANSVTEATKRKVWAAAHSYCSNPECKIYIDAALGEAAHIVDESLYGLYRPDPEEKILLLGERNKVGNLLWLCNNCHQRIDDVNNLEKYTVEYLREMKAQHEKWVKEELLPRLQKNSNKLSMDDFRQVYIQNALNDLYSTNETNQRYGALVLAQANPPALEELKKALEHPSPYARREVAYIFAEYLHYPASISTLLEILFDANLASEEHMKAVKALTKVLCDESTQALRKVLAEHKDRSVRSVAVEALGQLSLDILIAIINDPSEDPNLGLDKRWATYMLGNIDSLEAVPCLQKALDNKFPEIREGAAVSLGKLHAITAIPNLTRTLLTDKDITVKTKAATALGEIGTVEAIKGLEKALNDKDYEVRVSVVKAFGLTKAPEATDALAKALQDPDVREVAFTYIRYKGENAIPILCTLLNDLGVSAEARQYAARLLGYFEHKSAVMPLIQALAAAPEGKIRIEVAIALGQLKDERAVPSLVTTLKDKEIDLRLRAVKALQQIGTAEAVNGLLTALTNDKDWIRKDAAIALGELGLPDAIDLLFETLQWDGYSTVRDAAEKALQRIPEAKDRLANWRQKP